MKPMLAQRANVIQARHLTDAWWFEQKLDGTRILVQVDHGQITGYGRNGQPAMIPGGVIAALANVNGRFILDGELINGVLWAFDMPEGTFGKGRFALDLTDPAHLRRTALETVFDHTDFYTASDGALRIIPRHTTTDEKVDLERWCEQNVAEGIMLKQADAPYIPGKRVPFVLKHKYVETADCIVGAVRPDGKSSVTLYLVHDGKITKTDVGAVKCTDEILAQLTTGTVIEVEYLYATPALKLYQAQFKKIRGDKDPNECTTDQLKFLNEKIVKAN